MMEHIKDSIGYANRFFVYILFIGNKPKLNTRANRGGKQFYPQVFGLIFCGEVLIGKRGKTVCFRGFTVSKADK